MQSFTSEKKLAVIMKLMKLEKENRNKIEIQLKYFSQISKAGGKSLNKT